MWTRLKSWVRAVVRRSRMETEMDAELRFHVDAYAQDLMRGGMAEEEARRRARMEFGGIEQAKEECRAARRISLIGSIAQDLRFALRKFRASPTITATAILTLALGIGANTAIFRLIDRVMLASLPVANPERLAQLRFAGSGPGREPIPTFTNAIWEATRDTQDVFSEVFAWDSEVPSDLGQGGTVDLADKMFVSGDFFKGLGVGAARGRLIAGSDDRRGCAPVAVLSYAFWQAHYGGQENAIGNTISLDKHKIPIIGVSASGFTGLNVGSKFDVAIPICSAPLFDDKESRLDHRSWWWLNMMGRIKPGLTLEQVQARLETISPQIFQQSVPDKWKKDGQDRFLRYVLVASLGGNGISGLRREYGKPLGILMGVVGLVLLIACANIASLMLARAITRTKELAVRKALGASRGRLVRQLLTECLLLSGAGALIGIVLAHWGNRVLVRFLSTSRAQVFLEFPLDLRVLGFTVMVTLLAAILFGLLPAFRATRVSLTAAMKGGGFEFGERRVRFRAAKWIVTFQVAISLVLLITAGLFLRSFVKLTRVDSGFDRNNVVIVEAGMKDGKVAEADRAEVAQQMEAAFAGIAGVASSGVSMLTPVSGSTWNDNVILDRPDAPSGDATLTYSNYVSPHYLETMRIPLLAGRNFDAHDTGSSPLVAIINETMAKRFYAGMDPIGQTFRFDGIPGAPQREIQVVGVMRDAKYEELAEETLPQAFMPLIQIPDPVESLKFVLRSTVDLGALIPSVVDAAGSINKSIPLRFQTLSKQVDDSLARERVLATLSGFFGGLALLLAMIGLYGALSYLVTQRRAEFGIRLALGAPRASILKLVLKDLLFVLGIGAVGGVGISLAAVGVLQKLLYGLEARDTATIATAVALLTLVAIAAALVPARRATRVDPAAALRYE